MEDETEDCEVDANDIFYVIKREEFVDLISKYNSELKNDLKELKSEYKKSRDRTIAKIMMSLKASMEHNEKMIEISGEDDDYMLYYMDTKGNPCFMRVTRDYKIKVYDLDRESGVAYA